MKRTELYKKAHAMVMDSENAPLQRIIDSGEVWLFEGSYGRAAMSALEDGACLLAPKRFRDFYGTVVPKWDDVKPRTKGTPERTIDYYGR